MQVSANGHNVNPNREPYLADRMGIASDRAFQALETARQADVRRRRREIDQALHNARMQAARTVGADIRRSNSPVHQAFRQVAAQM